MPARAQLSAPDQSLTIAEFAEKFGVSLRAARKAVRLAYLEGKPFRNCEITVEVVQSRGGKSGRAYRVLAIAPREGVSSLPGATPPAPPPSRAIEDSTERREAALPAPLQVSGSVAVKRSTATTRRLAIIEERYELIAPALDQPSGSRARAHAARAAARHSGKSERWIRQMITAFEKSGLAGLAPKERSDAGQRRYHISRVWDSGVPFSSAEKKKIAAETTRRVRSLWANSTELGWRQIGRYASRHLTELTRKAGYQGTGGELRAICRLPHNFVMPHRPYRAIAIHDQDAKQWHDNRPRIQRDRTLRQPMEIVVCDVHPMDVLLPRPDGSTFTAKLIAFEDWATARVFLHPVFLPKGEGVRQEHVAEAIVAMMTDERWGVPSHLYIDNGGEYGCAELTADAMWLSRQHRELQCWLQIGDLEDNPTLTRAFHARQEGIIKAKPYNASAKSIEGTFNVLEKGVFSALPGWIGGNRMAKKTTNVGQAPVPYQGGEEAFREDLQNCITAYETNPQTGQLQGRSPRQVFEEAIAAGWKRVDVERGALLAAFARDETRTLRQGSFTYAGRGRPARRYTAPELHTLPAGTKLHLRPPIWGKRDLIPVMAPDGSLLCVAEADVRYDALDPEGARESARRLKRAKAGVKAMRDDVDELDMRAELASIAEQEDPVSVPESAGMIRLDSALEDAGRVLARTQAERRADEAEQGKQEEISQERRDRLVQQFLGRTGTDG